MPIHFLYTASKLPTKKSFLKTCGLIAIAAGLSNSNFGGAAGFQGALPTANQCTTASSRTPLLSFAGLTDQLGVASLAAQTFTKDVNSKVYAKITVTSNDNGSTANSYTVKKTTYNQPTTGTFVPAFYHAANPHFEYGGYPQKANSRIDVVMQFLDRVSNAPVSINGYSFALIDVDHSEGAQVIASNAGASVVPDIFYNNPTINSSSVVAGALNFWTTDAVTTDYPDYDEKVLPLLNSLRA